MTFGFKDIVNIFGICLLLCILQLSRFMLVDNTLKTSLSYNQMQQDLDSLFYEIERHSAFTSLDPSRLQKIKQKIDYLCYRYPVQIDANQFHTEMVKLLAQLDDPGLYLSPDITPTGQLPFTLRPMGDFWLALDTFDNPLALEHPFVTHIDGIPISRWLNTAKHFMPKSQQGSPRLQRQWLSQIDILRTEMGIESAETLTLSLSNGEDSKSQLELTIPLKLAPVYQELSLTSLDKTAVPIKIADLNNLATDNLMQSELKLAFENPLTLLDLREASGVSNTLLNMLINEFADPTPLNRVSQNAVNPIFTLAQYRRSIDFKSDYLRPDYFRPLDELTFFEQIQISEVKKEIERQHTDHFSQLYGRKNQVMPSKHSRSNQLVLLIGPQCRQECEWVAYLARNWSRVTLVGEKTLGDIGKHYRFRLPNSKLSIELTTSLNYSNQGKLISGVGTQPDIQHTENEPLHWQTLNTLLNEQAINQNKGKLSQSYVTATKN